MKLENFLRRLPTLLLNDFDDARFVTIKLMTNGMTSARIAKMIYYATKDLDENEVYLEQGTWTGFTLVSAGLDGTKLVVGVDPYDLEFANSQEINDKAEREMVQNVTFHNTNALVFKNDFRNVKWDRPEKIGVLFVDADHTYQDVIDGMKWAEPLLSDKAIIIFDDIRTKFPQDEKSVEDAVFEWIQKPGYRLEALVRGGLMIDQYSHNGFAIVSYEKT